MLNKLKSFLQLSFQDPTKSAEKKKHQLNLAAACLLMEVVYADDTLDASEAQLLPGLLATSLDLDKVEITLLINEAKKTQGDATSLYEFTKEINLQFSIEQKKHLILAMWQLAYSTGKLCQDEDQIIRRTADLLYLKHSELIKMRNLALKEVSPTQNDPDMDSGSIIKS